MPHHAFHGGRRGFIAGAAGLAAASLCRPAIAQGSLDSVRFSCDFRIYGGTAPFFYGLDKGYFREAGIEARVDGAAGSAEAVTRVASGTYEFGCADISTVAEFAGRNPQAAPRVLMPIYDRFAAAIISPKSRGLDSFAALRGKTVGTGQSDAPSRILPSLLQRLNIPADSFNRVAVDIKLRDTMLLQGRVDAVVGMDYTVLFNLLGGGLPPAQVNCIYFADNGFDFYGQGLIVNQEVLARNPDLCRRMAVAVTRCWTGAARDPDGSIDSMMRREGLSDRNVERQRQQWVLDRLILTPNVRRNGIGAYDEARLRSGLAILAEGFQMQNPPTVEQVFDGRFIPDAALRRVA
ncbi:ABC transporter substrate-binding protein [Roseomonas sp. NAR14]|uniref:ABC transporter substrate-binding protein n=1 Tax=Roseomonas acroporae TaxID=2937791 RepID=A0A9X1YDE9_9PROT|nr:ABC transporter substrate-binding protein [Roseomonas acroporae]MCK8784501.1 ABC transporter substrate-binding protein [Roseomonas acroporae]